MNEAAATLERLAARDLRAQQNAASAEESSSSAAELAGEAERLAAMVSSFRLDDAPARPVLPAVPERAAGRRALA